MLGSIFGSNMVLLMLTALDRSLADQGVSRRFLNDIPPNVVSISVKDIMS